MYIPYITVNLDIKDENNANVYALAMSTNYANILDSSVIDTNVQDNIRDFVLNNINNDAVYQLKENQESEFSIQSNIETAQEYVDSEYISLHSNITTYCNDISTNTYSNIDIESDYYVYVFAIDKYNLSSDVFYKHANITYQDPVVIISNNVNLSIINSGNLTQYLHVDNLEFSTTVPFEYKIVAFTKRKYIRRYNQGKNYINHLQKIFATDHTILSGNVNEETTVVSFDLYEKYDDIYLTTSNLKNERVSWETNDEVIVIYTKTIAPHSVEAVYVYDQSIRVTRGISRLTTFYVNRFSDLLETNFSGVPGNTNVNQTIYALESYDIDIIYDTSFTFEIIRKSLYKIKYANLSFTIIAFATRIENYSQNSYQFIKFLRQIPNYSQYILTKDNLKENILINHYFNDIHDTVPRTMNCNVTYYAYLYIINDIDDELLFNEYEVTTGKSPYISQFNVNPILIKLPSDDPLQENSEKQQMVMNSLTSETVVSDYTIEEFQTQSSSTEVPESLYVYSTIDDVKRNVKLNFEYKKQN